ncbi:hypothetical protein PV325_003156 [Microctonus aethiopoides]|nr:hypothetical protein PV325_003156 [Microctonus aethiopoides]
MANSPTSIENQIDSFLEQFKRSGTKVMDDTVRGNYNVNSNISRSRSDNLDLEVLEAVHNMSNYLVNQQRKSQHCCNCPCHQHCSTKCSVIKRLL